MTAVHDPVTTPRHYLSHPSGIEAIEVTRHMTFTAGNAFKYVFRAEDKNGVEDYRKSSWYLVDTIDVGKSRIWIDASHEAQGRRRLVEVIDHEPDDLKGEFYASLLHARLGNALKAVHEMSARKTRKTKA